MPRWVADEATVTSSTSLQGFNPDLYKLLYGEIDEDLVHMTDEELADNYLSNPSRIGSVSDLASRTEPKYRPQRLPIRCHWDPMHRFYSMMDPVC
jgi:hypothetical protein